LIPKSSQKDWIPSDSMSPEADLYLLNKLSISSAFVVDWAGTDAS
jgi:hypothetical protein